MYFLNFNKLFKLLVKMFRIGSYDNLFSALAPMQDATNRMFMDILKIFGEPDLYVTEFLRVHESSIVDRKILDVLENRTSKRPISVQLLGRDPKDIVRVARLLQQFDICCIDINFGCPMPKIHKKGVGGGLLAELDTMNAILCALKENIYLPITVKSRIGFENSENFENILEIFARNSVDCLFLHARTVKDLYREPVEYSRVALAKKILNCPVIVNGDIVSAEKAFEVVNHTKCDGVMIGRSAIRNPWIFKQVRQINNGEVMFSPTLGDVFAYVLCLVEKSLSKDLNDFRHVSYMKKFTNFIGQCIDVDGKFLREIRAANTIVEFLETCKRYMLGENFCLKYNAEPFKGVIARPNCE